ncbi:SHOCT domain-containing protein [Collimonas sp. NPDC087041]|uniref:SHOCT domain-containing protein n=1 Tax=Collimonas sp. NPDC087041 TaxID=3363960 RepID=UPI0037F8A112
MRWEISNLPVLAILFLSSCAVRPSIDYSKIEQECGMQCQMNDQACSSRYAGFPLILQANCNPEVEACVRACPPRASSKGNSNSTSTSGSKPSVTDRLNELDALHKNGVITDSEYSTKKQEILKSL